MSPILRYGSIKLLNVPHADAVADEVLKDDVYRIDTIPKSCEVIDIGGFYGEFAIACAHRGFTVDVYEPCEESVEVLELNALLNGDDIFYKITIYPTAVSNKTGISPFSSRADHPAGNALGGVGATVDTIAINEIFEPTSRYAIKLDCEGAEYAIFENKDWLKRVDWLSMEFHNHDADFFMNILKANGFTVEAEGGGPKPRPAWNKSIGGGMIHARKN